MIDRSKLAELYPNATTRVYNANDKANIISAKKIIVSAVSIAVLLTLSVATFMVMINYFMQIINEFNIISLLPMIAILLIAWVGMITAILMSVSKKLDKIAVTDTTFLITYGLLVLPVAQLTFNLYRHFNNGLVDVLPFIGLLLIENLLFIPTILLLLNNDKIVNKSKVILLVIMIMFCVLITYVNSIYQ